MGTLEPKSQGERPLEYILRNVSSIEAARRKVEVLCVESGGERLHARKVVPLQ